MGIESYFSGMAVAKAMAGSGQYFKGDGRYTLKTRRMFVNDGHKGKFFVAEFEVTESTNPDTPAGATRSWVSPLEGERAKYSFGDIKNLVFAVTGQNPKDVADPSQDQKLHQEATQLVMAACDAEYAKNNKIDPSDLIDQVVGLETFTKQTKSGKDFTVHSWAPVE